MAKWLYAQIENVAVVLGGPLIPNKGIIFNQLKEWQISNTINSWTNLADTFKEFGFIDEVHVAIAIRITCTKDICNLCLADGVYMMNYPAKDKLWIVLLWSFEVANILRGEYHSHTEPTPFTYDATEWIEVFL